MSKKEDLIKQLEQLNVEGDSIIELQKVFGELSDIESTALINLIPKATKDGIFDFTRFLNMAERKLGRCTDHVVNTDTDNEIPYYKFGREAYLSWFRGYRFQVSGDDNGGGDYGSSDTSLFQDCCLVKGWDKELKSLMAFSHLCQATTSYTEFWEHILKDSSLLDLFMKETGKYDWNCNCQDFELNTVINIVESTEVDLSTAHVISLARVFARNSGEQPKHLGELYYCKDFVAVKDFNNKVRALNIPKMSEDVDSTEQNYYRTVWYRFAHILLNLSGIILNYQVLRNREDAGLQEATGDYVTDGREIYDRINSTILDTSALNSLLNAGNASNV